MKKVFALFLAAAMMICGTNIVLAEDSASNDTYVDVTAYTYVVDNMRFWSGNTEIANPEGSCEVEVDITKRRIGNDRDKLIIASYSDENKLIGMYTVVHDIEFGKTSSVRVSVSVPENTVLGDVRAFVWDSFGGMNACSNVISRYNNGRIDPKLEYEKELQTSFADVPKDSEYAESIEFTALLGILAGDDEGYFNPTGKVTRADAAAALSHMMGKDQEAYYLRGESIYSDTTAGKIETGYLNLGYIEPVSGDNVAPYADITVGAFIKAAVNALGYKETAQVLGGWPTGYISTARTNGLLTGVKSNINEVLTKQELAVLCANTLDAPLMKVVGTEYTASGAIVPKKARMDGTNDNKYITLLNEVFDMYKLEGYVTETSRGGALNANEVNFGIAKSERYDHADISINCFNNKINVDSIDKITSDRIVTLEIGDTDANAYEKIYSKIIVKSEKNGKYTIISFVPSVTDIPPEDDPNVPPKDDSGEVLTFDVELIDTEEYEGNPFANRTETFIYIFEDDTVKVPSKYELQKNEDGEVNVEIYVNGLLMEGDSRELIDKYIIGAECGVLRLVDTSTADGYFDKIYIDRFMTAQVDLIKETDKKVYFKSSTNGATYVTISEDKVCNIYLDGKKASFDEIKKDDILSISYEYGSGNRMDFYDSEYYNIYISRNVETGAVTEKNDSKETVTIGGKKYKFVKSYDCTLKIGEEYIIYLDYFGKIYLTEFNSSSDKYAIVDKFVYSPIDENYQFMIFTAEGETKTITFDGNRATVRIPNVSYSELVTKTEKQNAILGRVYVNGQDANNGRTEILNRVIKYKISQTTGYITEVYFIDPDAEVWEGVEYKETTGSIGSVRIGNTTKIIDAIRYTANWYDTITDLRTATKASLVNGTKYSAYAFGEKIDGFHPFVIIFAGEKAYNARTRFAVVSDSVYSGRDEMGNDIYMIPALTAEDNMETVLKCSDELPEMIIYNLNVGNVIMYQKDDNGYIDDLSVIFTGDKYSGMPSYSELVQKSIVENNDTASFANDMIALPPSGDRTDAWTEEWDTSKSVAREPIQLIYGPIIEKYGNDSFSVGKIAYGEVDYGYTGLYTDKTKSEKEAGGLYEIFVNSDTAVYEYDYSESKRYRLSKGTIASIIPSYFADAYLLKDGDIIPWDFEMYGDRPNIESVNFAFAKVVNGVATDVFVINAP